MLIYSCSATHQSFYPQQRRFKICVTHSFCKGPLTQCVMLSPQDQWKLQANHISLNTWKNRYFCFQLFLMTLHPHVLLRWTRVCTHIIWVLKEQALKLLSYFGSFAPSTIELMAWAAEFCLWWHVFKQAVNSNYEETSILPILVLILVFKTLIVDLLGFK